MSSTYKLGRNPTRHDRRTLRFGDYSIALPTPPESVTWSKPVPATGWPMMGNDQVGDCTFAAAGHTIQCWTTNAAPPGFIPSDSDILTGYSAVTGYDPNDPSTDTGANELDVLNYWRNTGIAGHRIGAYVAVDPTNLLHVKQALWLFGGLYTGFDLPNFALPSDQGVPAWVLPAGQGLTGDYAPDPDNGHAIDAVDYDPNSITMITWGAKQPMNWPFFTAYCPELYAIISQDWIENNGNAPSGFNMAALTADLKVVSA